MNSRPQDLTPESLLEPQGWVKGLARSLVGDASTADDLVQEAWVVALERPPRDSGHASAPLAPWLGGVVRNLARLRARTEARRSRREEAAARAEGLPSTDQLVEQVEPSVTWPAWCSSSPSPTARRCSCATGGTCSRPRSPAGRACPRAPCAHGSSAGSTSCASGSTRRTEATGRPGA